MSPSPDVMHAALDRYLAGDMPLDDVPVLAREVAERPEAREELEALRAVVRAPVAYPRLASGDALWSRLAERMAADGRRRRGRGARTWIPVVGALAAALVVGVVLVPRMTRIERVAEAPAGALPLDAVPDTVAAPSVASGVPSPVPSPAHRDSASVRRPMDVARSPYAGTPLDHDAGQMTAVGDDEPGTADSHWP